MSLQPKTKRIIWVSASVIVILLALGALFTWTKFFREEKEVFANEEEHFKYGSLGAEGDRGIEAACITICHAEIVQRIGIVGTDREHPLEGRNGRIQFSRGIQHRAVIVVHFWTGTGQIRCPLQQFAGFFRAPLFETDNAEQMPRFRIVRLVHQYELAADIGILQPPRLEMRVRLVQRIAVHLFRISRAVTSNLVTTCSKPVVQSRRCHEPQGPQMPIDVAAIRQHRKPKELPFAITKLGHIVLNCSDMDRSVRFYTQVLGFDISDVYPDEMVAGGMVFMRFNEDHHGVALTPLMVWLEFWARPIV